jgi:L-threonylcarbamoyladenylate synthase
MGYPPAVSVTSADIDRAAQLLEEGGVVAFPTETVYGIGALATDQGAVERIFRIKGRPPERALIVHLHDATGIDAFAIDVPDWARRLGEEVWPGPLTLVLPARPGVSPQVTGGGSTVGLRVPDHPVALLLLAELVARRGVSAAIAAPSANKFGEPPPTTAQGVIEGLGAPEVGDELRPDMILDAGECPGGVPSTVLACEPGGPRILRQGAISAEALEAMLDRPIRR